jgi:hypothetical protein
MSKPIPFASWISFGVAHSNFGSHSFNISGATVIQMQNPPAFSKEQCEKQYLQHLGGIRFAQSWLSD